jgi:hypothetical protein
MNLFKPLVNRISKPVLTKALATMQALEELQESLHDCEMMEGTTFMGKNWIRLYSPRKGYSSKYFYEASRTQG